MCHRSPGRSLGPPSQLLLLLPLLLQPPWAAGAAGKSNLAGEQNAWPPGRGAPPCTPSLRLRLARVPARLLLGAS